MTKITSDRLKYIFFIAIISCSIVGICTVFFLIGLSLIGLVGSNQLLSTLMFSIVFLSSFVVLPLFIFQKFVGEKILYKVSKKGLLTSVVQFFVIFILLQLLFNDVVALTMGFVVAFSEEFLFRYVIFNYLEKEIGVGLAIILNSFIFALLLHINNDVASNLLIRFPIGIALSLIKYYFGFTKAVMGHWIYNAAILLL